MLIYTLALLWFDVRIRVWFHLDDVVCFWSCLPPLHVWACLHLRMAAAMKGLSRPLGHPRTRVVQQPRPELTSAQGTYINNGAVNNSFGNEIDITLIKR